MEQKTKITAEEGRQEMTITRDFDLPLDLLFKAYVDPDILEQWMTSKVIRLESKKNGSYRLEKKDDKGNVVFRAHGVIHEFIPDSKIVRTFEMDNTPFGVQLEIYAFEKLTGDTSRLDMHVIYESVEQRDQVMKLAFTQGINWAHNHLEEVLRKSK